MNQPNLQSAESEANLKLLEELRTQLGQSLVGKSDVIELVVACLISRGHLLLDDLPGLGKTTLAKALAASIGGRFARVQCTPDLLPSDVTGYSIFDQSTQAFKFCEGAVFSDVLLTDEINRTTPRTQSALFEAMAERQVTIDNQTYQLPPSFFVIATQNPVESHGTFPLPEAQLDRFAMKLSIGYPDTKDEVSMLGQFVGDAFEKVKTESVLNLERLAQIQTEVSNVEVCESVRNYLVLLGTETRNHPEVRLGLSPRALITWQRVAQAWAYLNRRDFVIPEDLQAVAQPVLALRIGQNANQSKDIIQGLLDKTPVPNESN